MKKPETPLTIIRTGTGDTGTTHFRSNKYFSKSNEQIKYLGLLDLAQSFAVDNVFVQDQLFALGAYYYNPSAKKYAIMVETMNASFEEVIKTKTTKLGSLNGFIRTTEENASLMQLRAAIRQAEQLACCLNKTEDMSLHIKSLNILSDYVFVCLWEKSLRAYNLKQWTGEPMDWTVISEEFRDAALKMEITRNGS